LNILDGKSVAKDFRCSLKETISKHKKQRSPGIAVVLVGEDPASCIYVKSKQKACEEVGIDFRLVKRLPSISQNDLINLINKLNNDENIDGILVQSPLPSHIDFNQIVLSLDPSKDVDGFHPLNVGKLSLGLEEGFVPCTPIGIMYLLKAYDISLEGKNVVIVGRSHIVGKPLAALMMRNNKWANATVTVAHSRSKNLEETCSQADVIVACCGCPEMITPSMVKQGAIIVDVGISRIQLDDGKSKLVGDVKFDDVKDYCSWITPVPRGVGPMTIAMLLGNIWKSYSTREKIM
jgi:methylenetetrahydrofolate dehydrogenase (NADP+) / methenyltetrahydrofolate cyclohydrolase